MIARLQKSNLFNDLLQLIVDNPWSTANVCVVVLLVTLEIIIPFKKSPISSFSLREDIFWLITNKFLTLNIWGLLTYRFGDMASRALAGHNLNLEQHSLAVQFIAFFLLSDLASYISHRLLHKNDYLWRFHQVHHSTEILTTTSSFRHHWLEGLYHALWQTTVASVLIVNPSIRMVMVFLIVTACYFQHANLKVRFPNWIDLIFITPLNHRWHHSQISVKPRGQNFGLLLSVWDRWLGSHFVPAYEPDKLGTDTEYPKTLFARLIYPFIK